MVHSLRSAIVTDNLLKSTLMQAQAEEERKRSRRRVSWRKEEEEEEDQDQWVTEEEDV